MCLCAENKIDGAIFFDLTKADVRSHSEAGVGQDTNMPAEFSKHQSLMTG